jgi:hypothetical protein
MKKKITRQKVTINIYNLETPLGQKKSQLTLVIAALYIILYFNAIYIYGAMDLQLLNNMIL